MNEIELRPQLVECIKNIIFQAQNNAMSSFSSVLQRISKYVRTAVAIQLELYLPRESVVRKELKRLF
jgi:CRISPR/Cas system type I-B associated protein Csh2 (Cas7 group RAMP superfamily)